MLRFRRSRGEERQQLKWFTYAAALVPLAVLDEFLPAPVDSLAFAVPVVLLPIAAGIAILRHRLYDIDRLINRTLVYGLFVSPRHIQQRTDCYQQAKPFARLFGVPGQILPDDYQASRPTFGEYCTTRACHLIRRHNACGRCLEWLAAGLLHPPTATTKRLTVGLPTRSQEGWGCRGPATAAPLRGALRRAPCSGAVAPANPALAAALSGLA